MTRFPVLIVLAGTLASLAPTSLEAQERFPLSLEMNIGWGAGRTHGEFDTNRNGNTADVLLGRSLMPALGGSIVTAVSASIQGAGESISVCVFRPTLGCVPDFPQFMLFAVLAGIENDRGTLRFLAGPAYVDMERSNASAVGIVARVDGALPVWGPLALAASLRAAAVPEIDGEAFQLYALGFGLRLR